VGHHALAQPQPGRRGEAPEAGPSVGVMEWTPPAVLNDIEVQAGDMNHQLTNGRSPDMQSTLIAVNTAKQIFTPTPFPAGGWIAQPFLSGCMSFSRSLSRL
jgi:hypothetical protein